MANESEPPSQDQNQQQQQRQQQQQQQPPQEPPMQLAHILSDLVSLRVCDPAAALALVSARPNTTNSSADPETSKGEEESGGVVVVVGKEDEQDVDIKRAKELVRLHYEVKKRHEEGELVRGLEEARGWVERVAGGRGV